MERDRSLWQELEADPADGVRLRVYAWAPPALSLGFHQDEAAVDREALVRSGYDLVRRPTGGAAVLHVDEITYSVTAGLGQTPLGRAVLEIHGGVARALAAAFRSVGFDVQFGGDGVPRDFACFSGAGGHEMTLAGRKLVGSALRRGRRAFLQHGSVLRSERHLELCSFMAGTAEKDREVARAELERRTCVIEDLEAERFAAALAAALGRECGLATERVDRFEALLAH